MSEQPSHNLGSLDIDMARRIDEVCRRFEADWREGRQPRIEDYLSDVPDKGRPVRRLRASILEMMLLVAALGVSFRWPGLSVPVGLLLLYTFAQRRDILRRQTRVALGQVALAVYLPPAVGLLLIPFQGWDIYLERFSLMPTIVPAALIMGLDWVAQVVRFSPAGTAAMVVLSLSPLAVIGGLGVVARRGIAWRIPCLIVASGMSALSTVVLFFVMSIPT